MRFLKPTVISAALLVLLSCSSKQPVQSPVSQQPAVAVPAETGGEAASAKAPAGLDGEWNGNSGEGMAMNFNVAENKVSGVYANFKSSKNGCSSFTSFGSDETAAISGKSFTVHGKHDQSEFTMSGSFTSDTEASGTIDWKMKTEICGAVEAQLKWTAKKGPAPSPSDDDE